MNLVQPELELALGPVPTLSLADITFAMLLAFALGVIIAMVYRLSVPGRMLSPTMQASLVLLAMVASMVMMVIGNNLARAFSLVGALAIVRFRTRLRSTWDISFVFFALAAGIATGVGAHAIGMIGTVVISLAVLALHVIPLSGVRGEVQLLRCDVSAYQAAETDLAAVLDRFTRQRWLLEARSLRFGETLSLRYRIELRDKGALEAMLRELTSLDGIERVVVSADDDAASEGGEG